VRPITIAEVARQALGATQSSARAAEQNAQLARVGLLPRIDVTLTVNTFEPGKKTEMSVAIKNTGNTTAVKFVTYAGSFRFDPRLPRTWSPRFTGPPSVSGT
jgi:hypothetical protein